MTHDTLLELLAYWIRSLKSDGKSKNTVEVYETGIRRFAAWCLANAIDPALSRDNVRGFTDYLLNEMGLEPATAQTRQSPLRLFSAWLADEEEIPRDELLGMGRVKQDQKNVRHLDQDEIERLLKACGNGKSKEFVDIRDYAIVLFMLDTTARANETISIRYPDGIDLDSGTATIERGKGGKGRRTSFGDKTNGALSKYELRRRRHRLAGSPEFWLPVRGNSFKYEGLYKMLKARGRDAGLIDFHPHVLRHSAAVEWLRAGGSERALMSKAGWSNPQQLHRYTETAKEELAIEETRRLNVMGRYAA